MVYDAGGKAIKIGSVRSANILLLGFSVGTGLFPFKHKDLGEVIGAVSKQKDREANLKAFDIGFLDGKQSNIAI
jgi:Pyruvate/2-oxoacid:ferredoxin oxidoreductase gamma subunit